MRSPANRRTRSSSAERKKRDSPGSPWRPERPRSWLSMRRDSWRSVPRMCRPPRLTTSSCSSCHCPWISASMRARSAGSVTSFIFCAAMYSGLPPRRMSVPRPAMFVAIVTAPLCPAWATISASRSWCFAFRTTCGTPWRFSIVARSSDFSIEKSELLATMLKRQGVPHVVLNAKHHEREAEIVAQAGHKGAVTIATNMAGRGTDILLGGNPEYIAAQKMKEVTDPAERARIEAEIRETWQREHEEVVSLGGLHILGTERHESRRIDNQLRGRSGRQGDPGSSRFYLSLEDDLMRIFAGDRVKAIMQRLGMEDGVSIESKMVSKRIEAAQKNVESQNFSIRKHLLEYDDVMNKQRATIYTLRRQLLEQTDQRGEIQSIAQNIIDYLFDQHMNLEQMPEEWDLQGLKVQIAFQFGLDLNEAGIDLNNLERDEIRAAIWQRLEQTYAEKETAIGAEAMRYYERIIMLNIVDSQWKDHLQAIDHLKEWINQMGYAQKDPLVEYKKQSFDLFEAMLDRIDIETVRSLYHLQVAVEEPPEQRLQRRPRRGHITFTKANATASAAGEDSGKPRTVVSDHPKIGRNDPCPCGSGKKYKKCHGAEV